MEEEVLGALTEDSECFAAQLGAGGPFDKTSEAPLGLDVLYSTEVLKWNIYQVFGFLFLYVRGQGLGPPSSPPLGFFLLFH